MKQQNITNFIKIFINNSLYIYLFLCYLKHFYKILQKPNFLPYKQRVTGSNPVAPTTKSATYDENLSGFFHG